MLDAIFAAFTVEPLITDDFEIWEGIVSEREKVNLSQAFALLRTHARNHNRRIADVANDVIDGSLSAATLSHPRPTPNH